MGRNAGHERVSDAMTRRLPAYYRHLCLLEKAGVAYISSRSLGEEMSLTDSQIRQDLSSFGGFGRQGRGYEVRALRESIGAILGLNRGHRMIIVGAGRLGSAIASFSGFLSVGFSIMALFDADERLVGTEFSGVPVLPASQLTTFLNENTVQIAVIAVPAKVAQQAVDLVCAGGVRGILNFAETDLRVPEGVLLQNVHLSDSLMALSFRMHELEILRGEKSDWT